MIRALLAMIGIFATVLLMAEALALGLLWSNGHLNSRSLREIRLALTGQSIAAPVEEAPEPSPAAPSEAEIQEVRINRVLSLEARETELTLLKRMTTETANRLISDRQAFDQLRSEFQAELARIQDQTVSAATEQTRAVLIASPPEESAKRLMGLTTAEGVGLLRGLPEKAIARILQAFADEPKYSARGQELFEGLYRGDPQRMVIDDTVQGLSGPPQPPGPPGGL